MDSKIPGLANHALGLRCTNQRLVFYRSSLQTKFWCRTIQMKAIEQYFYVVLFIMLYKVDLTFTEVCEQNPSVWPFKWKLLSSTFMWYCLLCCTRWFLLLSLWTKPWCVTNLLKAIQLYHSCTRVVLSCAKGSNFTCMSVEKALQCVTIQMVVPLLTVLSCGAIWFSLYLKSKFLSIMVTAMEFKIGLKSCWNRKYDF